MFYTLLQYHRGTGQLDCKMVKNLLIINHGSLNIAE